MKVEVCALADLPVGTIKGVAVPARPADDPSDVPLPERICVANVGGELRAFDGICTHAYAELDNGFLRDGLVMCPLHFSEFDTATGEALSPPADQPLATYPVKVEAERVVVEVP